MLFHEQVKGERRDLAALIQDECQLILYLVADKKEYMEREKKVPKAEFWGRMIPRYLIHYNFTLIRDFLDLFFLILPRPEPFLNNNFGAMAFGPKHLTKLDFEDHRQRLLEPQERIQPTNRLSVKEPHTAADTPAAHWKRRREKLLRSIRHPQSRPVWQERNSPSKQKTLGQQKVRLLPWKNASL